jgi:hypothetical protein
MQPGIFICGGWAGRISDASRRRWQRKPLQEIVNNV